MLVLKGSGGEVNAVGFSLNGRGLVAFRSTGRGLRVEHWPDWSAGGKPVAVGLPGAGADVELSPDGRHLLGTSHGRFVLHDLSTGTTAVLGPDPPDGYVSGMAFTPDGRWVVGSHYRARERHLECRGVAPPHLILWTVRTQAMASALAFVSGERFVAIEYAGAGGYEAVTRDAATGEPAGPGRHPVPYLLGLTASPDGTLVAGFQSTRLFVLRSADLSAAPTVVRAGGRKAFTGLAFHPSGRYLAATGNDATVKLVDATTWATARTFDWAVGRLRSVAFSPDGNVCAAGGDKGRVVVWDV